jgi:hypothetical protein
VSFGLHIVPKLIDPAVRPDQERTSRDAHERSAQEFLHPPSPVSFDGFVLGIAQQRKIQFFLGLETRQRFFGIGAGAQNHHAQLIKLLLRVTKLGRFDGSTGSVSFWKEKEEHALAFEIVQ